MKWVNRSIKLWEAGFHFTAWRFPSLLHIGDSCWWQLCLERQQAKQVMWWGVCFEEMDGWDCHSWRERWAVLAGREDVAFNLGNVDLRVPGSSRSRCQRGGRMSISGAQRRGLAGGTHLSLIWLWVVSDTVGLGDIDHVKRRKRWENTRNCFLSSVPIDCGQRLYKRKWREQRGRQEAKDIWQSLRASLVLLSPFPRSCSDWSSFCGVQPAGLRRPSTAPYAWDMRKDVCSDVRDLLCGSSGYDSGRRVNSKNLKGSDMVQHCKELPCLWGVTTASLDI